MKRNGIKAPLFGLALSLVLIPFSAASGAIAFDAQSSNSGLNVSSLSWPHTIGGGSDRKLIVGAAIEENVLGDEPVTGITYNGVALTFAQAVTVGTGFLQRVEIWYIDEADLPASGSYTIQVTTTGPVQEINAGAISIAGAQLGAPEATATNTIFSSAPITTPITTLTDGAWLIDVVGSGNGGSFTPGAGQTERWDTSTSSGTGASSTKPVATAGASSMTQTHSTTSNRTAHVVIAVAPASGFATFSSASNQTFGVGDPPTAAATITITDALVAPTITVANDLRIRIPAGFNMIWDTSVASVTLGGAAAGKASATLLPYEDGGRTVVLNVTTNFTAADQITVAGLRFINFTASSGANNLELEVNNDGVVSALDDKTITIISACLGGVAPPAVDAVSTGSTGGSSITISHTTAGADRLMLVGVSMNHEGLEFVTSVTYNGTSLTLVGTAAQSNDARIEIWRLVVPDTGTHDVVVTFNQNLQTTGIAGVITFTGVDQTTPLETFAGAFGNDSTAATVNVPSATGELVFGAVAAESPGSLTVGAGQTERWNLIVGSAGGAGSTETGAPSVTTSWTLGSADDWASGGVSIKPACSGVPQISSAANQSFTTGDPPTTAATITIMDGTGAPTITAANDLRIRIPAGFNMMWDTSVTSITLGGSAAGKVSTTLLPYEDGGKTVVLNVTSDFVRADQLIIDGLQFTSFTAASAADNLELEVNNDGVVSAFDDKTITIVPPGPAIQPFILSTEGGATLGGLTFEDEDLVEYDPATDIATMFLEGDTVFTFDEDVDAVHILANGNVVLSPTGTAQIGALTFQDEDLVEYDPVTGIATMLFDGSTIFSANEDIDAVFVPSNGHIILSTEGGAQIGALTFQDEDLVEYDPVTGIATMFFDGSTVFAANEDVDGFHILPSGNLLLSTEGTATIGSLTFLDGDVVEYDPGTGTAQLFFDESNFSASEDIDAITINVPPVGVLDHFAISHSGLGVTCEAEPVAIIAHDTGHTPVAAGTSTTITGSTTPNADQWALRVGAGVFTDLGGGQFSYTFAAGETEVGLWLTQTTAAIIDIDIVDGSGNTEDGSEDPSLDFRDTGFRFYADGVANTIGTQISRKENDIAPGVQAMTLRAVQTSTDTGACEARLTGAQVVEMAFECDNPNTCVVGQVGTITGAPAAPIPGNPDGSVTAYAPVNLTFDATGTAPFTFNYTDAGRIALHARKDLPATPPDPAITLTGATNDFVVKPAGLCVESTDANSDCVAGDNSCSAFVKAGTSAFVDSQFNLTINAVGWETAGETNADFCAGNIVTPNFQLNAIGLDRTLVAPAGGTNGVLGVTSFDMVAADNGQHTITNQAIEDVGVYTIIANPPAYLGETVAASTSANIGRFYPDRFNITPNAPTFADSCVAGTFTYIDETFYYGTAPVLTVTALNTAGVTTDNYGGMVGPQRFWMLTTLLPGRNYMDQAGAAATFNPPMLGGTVTLSDDTDYDGDGTLTMDAGMAGDDFLYQRVIPEAPFSALADLNFPAADLTDVDGVCYDPDNNGTCDGFNINGITGTQMRFGRLVIDNAFGSELLDLSMRATTQFYQSVALGFVVNTNDVCTDTTLGLSNFTGNLSLGETCVQDTGSPGLSGAGCPAPGPVPEQFAEPPVAGDFNLFLLAPGVGNDGSVDVEATLPAWLRYDWDGIDQGADGNIYDDNPIGRATFGIFKGNARHIYLRELY